MAKELFEAESFAVVGASNNPNKAGHIIFRNLIEKNIKAYPVNPNHKEILNKKVYPSLSDFSEKPDCVIIAVPAKFTPEILEQAGERQIQNAVIISSGFSETGNNKLSEKVKQTAEKYKIKILGPNSLGFINPYLQTNATFFEGEIQKGKTAFLSQSGAIGAGILDKQISLSGFISLGNSLNTDFSDYISYFNEDKNTEQIALYIESLQEGKGQDFIKACRNSKKPIAALKAGKMKQGQKAALSHTAALTTEKGIYEGVFKQCRIKEVQSISELFSIKTNLSKIKPTLNKKQNRACIITNAGGLGVLTSDYCEENNIQLPQLPKNIIKQLNKTLPSAWSHNNPVDVVGDAQADRFEKVFQILENQDWFDFFIILLTPQYMTEPEKTAQLLLKLEKPVIACFMGGKKIQSAKSILENKIPFFEEPKDLVESIKFTTTQC